MWNKNNGDSNRVAGTGPSTVGIILLSPVPCFKGINKGIVSKKVKIILFMLCFRPARRTPWWRLRRRGRRRPSLPLRPPGPSPLSRCRSPGAPSPTSSSTLRWARRTRCPPAVTWSRSTATSARRATAPTEVGWGKSDLTPKIVLFCVYM